MKFIKKLRY